MSLYDMSESPGAGAVPKASQGIPRHPKAATANGGPSDRGQILRKQEQRATPGQRTDPDMADMRPAAAGTREEALHGS